MRRQQSLDRDNGQRVAHRTRRCDLLARRKRCGNDDALPLQTFIVTALRAAQAGSRNDDRFGVGFRAALRTGIGVLNIDAWKSGDIADVEFRCRSMAPRATTWYQRNL